MYRTPYSPTTTGTARDVTVAGAFPAAHRLRYEVSRYPGYVGVSL